MNKDDILNMPMGADDVEDDEFDSIVTLCDEDGNEMDFEILDVVEYKDECYVVLMPPEEEYEDTGEVTILKIESVSEDGDTFVGIEDEEILNRVFELFKENNKDEFDFVD